jgi:hypothetical protein
MGFFSPANRLGETQAGAGSVLVPLLGSVPTPLGIIILAVMTIFFRVSFRVQGVSKGRGIRWVVQSGQLPLSAGDKEPDSAEVTSTEDSGGLEGDDEA